MSTYMELSSFPEGILGGYKRHFMIRVLLSKLLSELLVFLSGIASVGTSLTGVVYVYSYALG
jgi:hypothetical protein